MTKKSADKVGDLALPSEIVNNDAERVADRALRPQWLKDYVGQRKLKDQLEIYIEAAKARNSPLDHMLLYGPPGLGKTTLAHIIAKEMGVNMRQTSGPVLERPGDLVALLTGLEENDCLFIDEIHRMSPVTEEVLYPAMEDCHVHIMIGEGSAARSVKIDLPPFTLVGATTRAGMLSKPLRDRFGITGRLEFYEPAELSSIVLANSFKLGATMSPGGAMEIARRSRGTPRIANRLLRRVRDFAEVRGDGQISTHIADSALLMLEIDSAGLDGTDRSILHAIINKFAGGPVGLGNIASAVGEDAGTIEDVIEPYLIQSGFLQRTQRGRVATDAARTHIMDVRV